MESKAVALSIPSAYNETTICGHNSTGLSQNQTICEKRLTENKLVSFFDRKARIRKSIQRRKGTR